MEKLQSEEAKVFFSAFNYAAIGMALVAPDGTWLKVNGALCRIVGYTAEELLTKTFQDITHPDDLDEDLMFVNQMLAGEIKTYHMEKRYFHREGHVINVLLSVSLVRDSEGKPEFFISQIQDITRQKKLEADLFRMAREDELTKVFNRRHFMELASREVVRGSRFHEPQAIMMIDIDHFKGINDKYGHDVGDEVLCAMAAECSRALRGVDVFGRLGGEEFAALLLSTDWEIAGMLAERMRKRIGDRVVVTSKGPIVLTVSIGLATFTEPDLSLDELLRVADEALYEAKKSGRNRVVSRALGKDPGAMRHGASRSDFVRLEWKKEFESGCDTIDRQHHNLFLLANDFLGGIVTGLPDAEVNATAEDLLNEMITHFREEEALFRQAGYPDADNHSRIHNALVQSMRSILGKFKRKQVSAGDLFEILAVRVVRDHLLKEDRKFFPFLHSAASCTESVSHPGARRA